MTVGKPDNLIRTILRIVGVLAYNVGLAPAVIKLRSNRVRALLYHAVENQSDAFTDGLNVSVTPEVFAANLDYFKKHYNVVPMSTLEKGELPKRPLVITFDDGYRSVYQHAMPALHERDLSACIYLITRAVHGEIVWVNLLNFALIEHKATTLKALEHFEALANLKDKASIISQVQFTFSPTQIEAVCSAIVEALPAINFDDLYASEKDILDMQAHGLEFGFHTCDHYNLSNCSSEELESQMDKSGCENVMNSNTFAYPFGYFNVEAVAQAENKDFNRIMTVGNNNDVYSMKHLDRTEVFTDSAAEIFAQLEVVEPVIARLRKLMLKPGNKSLPDNPSPQNIQT